MSTVTVAALGEHEVLRRLRPYCSAIVGDDGAVQSLPTGKQLVVTTDVLVDGVHFCNRTLPPQALGWRAAAVNLSDLAAMGAYPLALTIGLTLPPDTPWPWLEGIYQGLTDCLKRYQRYGEAAIIGGDLCRGNQRSLSITALGSVWQDQAFYRNQAQPNQTLVTTGTHGASRAGLAILLGELAVSSTLSKSWTQAHQRPVPRFDAVDSLHSLDAQLCNVVAVMDSSDGLADAVIQICSQSRVGATLLRSQLPFPKGLIDTVGLSTAIHWTLYGGEDFELILSLPADSAKGFVKQLPGSQVIGYTTLEPDLRLVDDVDQGPDVLLAQNLGYQHF